jgi:predicted DNA-binding transcriptional regulator YafY
MIVEAIAHRKLLTLRYKGVERSVRPHILGYVGHDELALSAWQVSGTGSGWRLFHVDEIASLAETGQRFHRTSPGYNPDDPAFSRILSRL